MLHHGKSWPQPCHFCTPARVSVRGQSAPRLRSNSADPQASPLAPESTAYYSAADIKAGDGRGAAGHPAPGRAAGRGWRLCGAARLHCPRGAVLGPGPWRQAHLQGDYPGAEVRSAACCFHGRGVPPLLRLGLPVALQSTAPPALPCSATAVGLGPAGLPRALGLPLPLLTSPACVHLWRVPCTHPHAALAPAPLLARPRRKLAQLAPPRHRRQGTMDSGQSASPQAASPAGRRDLHSLGSSCPATSTAGSKLSGSLPPPPVTPSSHSPELSQPSTSSAASGAASPRAGSGGRRLAPSPHTL